MAVHLEAKVGQFFTHQARKLYCTHASSSFDSCWIEKRRRRREQKLAAHRLGGSACLFGTLHKTFSVAGEMKEVKKKSFRLKTIRSEAFLIFFLKKKFNCREKRDKIEVMKLANLDFLSCVWLKRE